MTTIEVYTGTSCLSYLLRTMFQLSAIHYNVVSHQNTYTVPPHSESLSVGLNAKCGNEEVDRKHVNTSRC